MQQIAYQSLKFRVIECSREYPRSREITRYSRESRGNRSCSLVLESVLEYGASFAVQYCYLKPYILLLFEILYTICQSS